MKKKDNLDEFNISPYYKGLLFTERSPGTSSEAENTNPTAYDFRNLYLSSPYYKGLLFTERAPGTSSEAKIANPTAHDFQNSFLSSPYYKGLLYTEKVTDTGTNVEAESTTGGITPPELMNSYSPYYKGLLNLNQGTTPDRESLATMIAGSSSSASFSVRGFIRKTFSLKEMKEEVTVQLKDERGGTKNKLMIEDIGVKDLTFDLEPEFDFGPIQHPIEPSHEDGPIQFPMPHSFYLISDKRMEEDQFSDRKTPEPQMVLHKEDDALKAIESPVIMVRKRHPDHTNAIIPVSQTPPIHAHTHKTNR